MTLKKLALAAAMFAAPISYACDKCEKISAAEPAVLLDNVTALHHPVTTKSPEAQTWFDQGLSLVFAFNHDEAIRSFKKAAEIDPQCAMAWWGVALALGPNYNIDVTPETEVAAYEAIQKAVALKDKVSQVDRDYIDTMAVRFTNAKDPDLKKLAHDYVAAARKLSEKYPDDMDAATMYAESLMLLRPWKLFTPAGEPEPGTNELIAVLEHVLRRDPNHVGANHLYIHAVENSPNPEKGLPSADRLPLLSPASGHLVHMPSHIYQRVGDYDSAASSNEAAIAVDDEYFKTRSRACTYGMLYYNHNVHFASWAHAWQGNLTPARKFARKLHDEVIPILPDMPMLEQFVTFSGLIELGFAQWDAILSMPKPADNLKMTLALWHFERAMALAATGKLPEARSEREQFDAVRKSIPAETMYGMLNPATDVFAVADELVAARLAEAEKDFDKAVAHLTRATELQRKLVYEEPAAWPFSCRQNLGGLLLRAGRYADAEKAFREDLKYYPRHGRSLFGLWQSLARQGREYEASVVERQFESAWKRAEVKLNIDML